MKKQILNLEGVAVLTKEQQKMVNGGTGGSSNCNCNTDNDCDSESDCVNDCGGFNDGHTGYYHGLCRVQTTKPKPGFGLKG